MTGKNETFVVREVHPSTRQKNMPACGPGYYSPCISNIKAYVLPAARLPRDSSCRCRTRLRALQQPARRLTFCRGSVRQLGAIAQPTPRR